jgi:hypothetical protein
MAIATVGQPRFKSGKLGSFTLIALRDISFDIITVREAGKVLRRRTLGSFRKTRMQSTDVHYRGFVLPNYNSGGFCLYLHAMRVEFPDTLFVVRLIRRCHCLNIKRHSQVHKVADSAFLLGPGPPFIAVQPN